MSDALTTIADFGGVKVRPCDVAELIQRQIGGVPRPFVRLTNDAVFPVSWEAFVSLEHNLPRLGWVAQQTTEAAAA